MTCHWWWMKFIILLQRELVVPCYTLVEKLVKVDNLGSWSQNRTPFFWLAYKQDDSYSIEHSFTAIKPNSLDLLQVLYSCTFCDVLCFAFHFLITLHYCCLNLSFIQRFSVQIRKGRVSFSTNMEKTNAGVGNGDIELPIGFRFRPTDEELLLHYLIRKIYSLPLPATVITQLDVFSFNPWDLPGM